MISASEPIAPWGGAAGEGMGEAVFTYGSLEFADVMEAVTGRRFEVGAATLEGYRRRLLHGRAYPAIVPQAGERTEGMLYREIDAGSLELLDEYESDIYLRTRVEVRVAEHAPRGSAVFAWAWVLRPAFAERLSRVEWDRERFLREHHAPFLEACRRFNRERIWIEPS